MRQTRKENSSGRMLSSALNLLLLIIKLREVYFCEQ